MKIYKIDRWNQITVYKIDLFYEYERNLKI